MYFNVNLKKDPGFPDDEKTEVSTVQVSATRTLSHLR